MFNGNIYEKNWYSKTCSMGIYMRKTGTVKHVHMGTHMRKTGTVKHVQWEHI